MWLAHGAQIDENYYRKEIKVADEGLALAGLRLTSGQRVCENFVISPPSNRVALAHDGITSMAPQPQPNEQTEMR